MVRPRANQATFSDESCLPPPNVGTFVTWISSCMPTIITFIGTLWPEKDAACEAMCDGSVVGDGDEDVLGKVRAD